MARRPKREDIAAKIRQVDVQVSRGRSFADAMRSIGVTEITSNRWRNEFGGLKVDPVKHLKDLETYSQRLRNADADLTLGKPNFAEAAQGK